MRIARMEAEALLNQKSEQSKDLSARAIEGLSSAQPSQELGEASHCQNVVADQAQQLEERGIEIEELKSARMEAEALLHQKSKQSQERGVEIEELRALLQKKSE